MTRVPLLLGVAFLLVLLAPAAASAQAAPLTLDEDR